MVQEVKRNAKVESKDRSQPAFGLSFAETLSALERFGIASRVLFVKHHTTRVPVVYRRRAEV